MKKFTIIAFIIFAILKVQAQNYLISFAGTGDTTAIDTIKVYNLTRGDTVILKGGDILHLKAVEGIETLGYDKSPLQIFPDPMKEKSVLTLVTPNSGIAVISILDISGKTVRQLSTY